MPTFGGKRKYIKGSGQLHDPEIPPAKRAKLEASATPVAEHQREENVPNCAPMELTPEEVFGSWNSWRDVKKNIFSNTVQGVAAAAKIIGTWHCRCGGRCFRSSDKVCGVPKYVDATLIAVEAYLLDAQQLAQKEQPSSGGSLLTPKLAQSNYATAFGRVVHELTNGTTLAKHARGTTYREKGAAVSLPEELIEIRNQVAHGTQLPSLTAMRFCCSLTLAYLFQHYWLQQERQLKFLKADDAEEQESSIRTSIDIQGLRSAVEGNVLNDRLSLHELQAKVKQSTTEREKAPLKEQKKEVVNTSPWQLVSSSLSTRSFREATE